MATATLQVGMHVMQSDFHLTENPTGTVVYVSQRRLDGSFECIVRWHERFGGKAIEAWCAENALVAVPAVAPAWVNAKY